MVLRQRIEYRAYVHPEEKQEYIELLKSHSYIIVWDEAATLHDTVMANGKVHGIALMKDMTAVFSDKIENDVP